MVNFTFWQDDKFFIGFLNEFPDYQTQGESINELKENLKDIYLDIQDKKVPFVRQTASLAI